MKRVAVFGGTFDPVHIGHLMIARRLIESFELDLFVFIPAFHAPHKPDRLPTSAFHRFAMLAIATQSDERIAVSTLELEKGVPRYSIETIPELLRIYGGWKLFFVMGADSWADITTWKRWEDVLKLSNHIVVSRPGYSLCTDHVSDDVRKRIVDVRGDFAGIGEAEIETDAIYLTDSVFHDVSASELREDLSDGELDRKNDVPIEVAKYVEKYDLY